jgi:hypothetical protein
VKGELAQYAIEVFTLNERRRYSVLDIDIHLNKANNQIFVIEFEKVKGKVEAYECPEAVEIYRSFQEYKRIAEDAEDRRAATRTPAK